MFFVKIIIQISLKARDGDRVESITWVELDGCCELFLPILACRHQSSGGWKGRLESVRVMLKEVAYDHPSSLKVTQQNHLVFERISSQQQQRQWSHGLAKTG